MNGGYILVNCKGLNLLAQSSQTINGLYKECVAAMNSGKPVIAANCVYGAGVPMSPVPVMCIIEGDYVVFTSSILQVWVKNDDTVTIESLITNTAKSVKK